MTKRKFYLLSFTWGIIMTAIGLVAAAVLSIVGRKAKKFGLCYCYEVGENWGGLSLGFIIITSKNPSTATKCHEHGHAIQNCMYGVLMPFIVSIPSAVRYWYREIIYRTNRAKYWDLPEYDAIWFEGRATELGIEYMARL